MIFHENRLPAPDNFWPQLPKKEASSNGRICFELNMSVYKKNVLPENLVSAVSQ